MLIVTDPRTDSQAVTEASYCNIPTIAFCGTDSPLCYVDVGVSANNKLKHSVALLWWVLAHEILYLRGQIPRTSRFEVIGDIFFYRDLIDVGKVEETRAIQQIETGEYDPNVVGNTLDAAQVATDDPGWDTEANWDLNAVVAIEDWGAAELTIPASGMVGGMPTMTVPLPPTTLFPDGEDRDVRYH